MPKKDPRAVLEELKSGSKALGEVDSKRMGSFVGFVEAAEDPGALDSKVKHLIGVALSLSVQCEYCIVSQVYEALEAGATREELIETLFMTGLMSGAPAVAYGSTLFLDSINTFAPEFEKAQR